MAVPSAAAVYAAARTQRPASTSLTTTPRTDDAHTLTALSRWSLPTQPLPPANKIRSLHVYDFDNTLFKTPLPNARLWNSSTLGYLASNSVFRSGGWWHDVRMLSATGAGVAAEEPRAWEGWWNESVVDLVRLSEKQPDALCVLLTGRAERTFGDLLQRMVKAKGLHFDLVVLRPAAGPNNENFSSTMRFKQAFLTALIDTYAEAVEIRIYEDRPHHVDDFRTFLSAYQQETRPRRKAALIGEVVPVRVPETTLDPVVEVAEVQHMVRCHNAAAAADGATKATTRLSLHKTAYFTAYLLQDADTQRLLVLLRRHLECAPGLPAHVRRHRDLRFHGNSIMIAPQSACPEHLLRKAGGLGHKQTWVVEALGHVDYSVWAAKVRPVLATPDATVHTAEATPLVVLAVQRNTRPHTASRIRQWHPVAADDAFAFETTVGERAVLRVELERGVAAGNANDGSIRPDASWRGTVTAPPANVPLGPSALKRRRVSTIAAGTGTGHALQQRPRGGVGVDVGGSRGYPYSHFAAGGRGGGGGGGGGGNGSYRGSTYRGGGYRGVGGPSGRGGGRGGTHYYHGYHSLDDTGTTGGAASSIAYDDVGR